MDWHIGDCEISVTEYELGSQRLST